MSLEVTRQIVATPRFEYNLGDMRNQIQAEFNRQGLGCYVENVWKIRGETQDTVVIETLAPAESPISEMLVIAICATIMSIMFGVVVIYALGFLERRQLPDGRILDMIHDIIEGLRHDSVDDMIQWKMENHPDDFAANPYWCPYCGAEFPEIALREEHVTICAAAPPPPPTPPPVPPPGPGYMIRYILQAIGWRITAWKRRW